MTYKEKTEGFVENIMIRRRVNQGDLLAQLAEESAELAQAALKLRRAFDGMTPVPVTDALENLYEEVADVLLCFDVFANHGDATMRPIAENIERTAIRKRKRWLERLINMEGKDHEKEED